MDNEERDLEKLSKVLEDSDRWMLKYGIVAPRVLRGCAACHRDGLKMQSTSGNWYKNLIPITSRSKKISEEQRKFPQKYNS